MRPTRRSPSGRVPEYLELWNPATYSVHVEDSPPANAIIAINSGPYAGYRDQAAPFPDRARRCGFTGSGDQDTGLSTICSLRGPRQGPVFPPGYECYCPITEVMTDGHGQLRPFDFAGPRCFYAAPTMAWNPDDKPTPATSSSSSRHGLGFLLMRSTSRSRWIRSSYLGKWRGRFIAQSRWRVARNTFGHPRVPDFARWAPSWCKRDRRELHVPERIARRLLGLV
jgi:hypothetical protein